VLFIGGLRFVVDRPVPSGNRRRRVDILLRGTRIAAFVDGCFWHSCPEHSHLPRTNTSWWRLKSAASPAATATPMLNSLRQAG
jgi:G:T-mismatch repair DNA endonuclease (very short patch repair protein)